jgi:folate-dependent phosphoribosylglycinamide formyltransferase PurN
MTRIVMTTNDSARGRLVLDRIRGRGVVLDAVLVLAGDFGPPPPEEDGRRRLARWPRRAASTLRRRARFLARRRSWYRRRCARVVMTGDMNSRRLLRDLTAAAPDYLVLGGGGIVAPAVIATARRGVLNAHPALLPWVRGCHVVGHSLEQGVALGATVHFVDAGIDTGPLIERRLLPVPPGPVPLGSLSRAVDELAADIMADVVQALALGQGPPRAEPQDRRYPLFLLSPPEQRPAHEPLARSGRAGELFEQWKPRSTDTSRWTIPLRSPDERPVPQVAPAGE